jgi:hypothetical protein
MGHMQGDMYSRAGRSEHCKFLSREGPKVSHRARGRAVDDPDLLQHRAALRRDQPAHVSTARGRVCRKSASAAAMRCSTAKHCARCTHANAWSRSASTFPGSVPMAWSATAPNVTAVDRRRAPRRLRRRRFLGTDAFPQGAQPHPRSRRVLHPGLERGGAGAAQLRRRDATRAPAGAPFIREHVGTKAIRRLTVRHHSRHDRRARTQN